MNSNSQLFLEYCGWYEALGVWVDPVAGESMDIESALRVQRARTKGELSIKGCAER